MTSVAGAGGILFLLCLKDRGGAEISMIALAQGLADRLAGGDGRKVMLAVYGSHPELARELGFRGEIVDLDARRTFGAVIPLYRLLRGGRFRTVISVLTHTNIAAALAAAAASLSGSRIHVLATEHGIDGVEDCAASGMFAALTRFAYGRAAHVVAVSQGLARRWRDFLPPRVSIVTVYNPVVPDKAEAPPPPAHEWLTHKEMPVIIGIGRLKKEKNFAFLLRAFARIGADKNARLVLIGEGEQRTMLENLGRQLGVGDRVLMPGFIADPRGWLAYAAMLACPSRREGFGNVIVESLALGVPVVASDCPFGPAEILENGRYGRLVPVDDDAALARAIEDTLIERALATRPDAGLLRARANDFTFSRCIDGYLALIDSPM